LWLEKEVWKWLRRKRQNSSKSAHIYIGIGGWTFGAWRGCLSGKADAGEGAGICGLKADLDRDQRHYYGSAKAGELSQMAREVPDGFCVLAEGATLATNRRCWRRPEIGKTVL